MHHDPSVPADQDHCPTLAFFGHDFQETTIVKRVRAFADADIRVIGFMYRRDRFNRTYVPEWTNVPLGTMPDRRYASRLARIAATLPKLITERKRLRDSDAFYARNLDMCILALGARLVSGKRVPLVYEALDVHPILTRPDLVGRLCRLAERMILRHAAMLVVSAPEFVEHFFIPVQGYRGPVFLLENKVFLPKDRERFLAAIEANRARVARRHPNRWVVAWCGTLKCERSLQMIKEIAAALPDFVEFHLHGYPTDMGVERLRALIDPHPNITYFGEYKLPEDLPRIYGSADFSWTFDFCNVGANSQWCLPNRLYEAPLNAVLTLTSAETATGRHTERMGLGWTFSAPYTGALIDFFRMLNEIDYLARRQAVARMPASWFYDDGDAGRLYDALQVDGSHRAPTGRPRTAS
jgi:succinoglycan biosynthesis protein ExoL